MRHEPVSSHQKKVASHLDRRQGAIIGPGGHPNNIDTKLNDRLKSRSATAAATHLQYNYRSYGSHRRQTGAR